ncbi:MAG: OmpH family outer membrane protein [Smithella sp.]
MKKSVYLITIITALFVFVWSASSLAAEKEDKIGFIDLRQIMQNSNAGKKDAEDFKKLYDKKNEEIKSAEGKLKAIKDDLDKQGSIMTQSSRSEKESAYQKKLRDYQYLVNDTNEKLKKRDQEMTQKLVPEIMKIVHAIAEKEKYTLVIDLSTAPMPYHAKENDFSQKVIEKYNKTE